VNYGIAMAEIASARQYRAMGHFVGDERRGVVGYFSPLPDEERVNQYNDLVAKYNDLLAKCSR